MNKQCYKCCPPRKKKRKKHHSEIKKIGLVMILLGIVTVFVLVLPLSYWMMLMGAALIVLGVLLLKK